MRLQLDGISPSTDETLIARLDTSSTDQFVMSSGSVTANEGSIQVNLQRSPSGTGTAVAQGVFGLDSPVTVSRVEVDLLLNYNIYNNRDVLLTSDGPDFRVLVAGLGLRWGAKWSIPPKSGRVYSFASPVNLGALESLSIDVQRPQAPTEDGPLFTATDYARILRIEVYGEWWWGE